jgi:hypothetical protein
LAPHSDRLMHFHGYRATEVPWVNIVYEFAAGLNGFETRKHGHLWICIRPNGVGRNQLAVDIGRFYHYKMRSSSPSNCPTRQENQSEKPFRKSMCTYIAIKGTTFVLNVSRYGVYSTWPRRKINCDYVMLSAVVTCPLNSGFVINIRTDEINLCKIAMHI